MALLTRKQPRPDNRTDVPTYQPKVGDMCYFITGGPSMTITALVKDHNNIPWAAECGWYTYNNDFTRHTFAMELLCDGEELLEDDG